MTEKTRNRFINDIYVNREYSWLLFDKRVLEQSQDLSNPLLERCKFLSIFSSNLDEFFMVRVGSLYNESLSDAQARDNKTQLTAAKQLEGVCEAVRDLYAERAVCYSRLKKELSKYGVRILRADELTPRQKEEAKTVFMTHVLPL